MNINEEKIVLKSLIEEDIIIFSKWFDKGYIKKWLGEKEHWLHELNKGIIKQWI